MQHELIIDGNRFSDYDGFVEELNRAYLTAVGGIPWNGEIDDLHEILETTRDREGEPLTIRWINSRKSASVLGHNEMAEFWRRSMANIPAAVYSPDGYQLVLGWYQERLDQAMARQGRTLFEYLVWQVGGEGDDLVNLKLE